MHFKIVLLAISKRVFAVILCSLALVGTTRAGIDEIYKLSLGTTLTRFDSSFSINSNSGSLGDEIDFEDDLGMDSDTSSSWISGWYRVGDNHRIRLTIIPMRRSSVRTSNRDFIIDGTTITSGAVIATDARSDIYDFSYIYSLYKKPDLEVGFSAGLYWLRQETRLLAAGNVISEGDTIPVFDANYSSQQKLHAPMPLLGLTLDYEITPSWRTHASLRFLQVAVSGIDGNIASAEFGTEYYFNKNWGLGLSLTSFTLKVDVSSLLINNSLVWSHNAGQVYAVFKY